MGISEQARNITDTNLKLVLTASDEPVEALKQHILKLESSLREVAKSEEFLVRQCEWLSVNVERNLKLAEESETRAARALQLGREDLAREALREKRESLRQMSADRRQMERLERSLPGLRDQRQQIEQRISQARGIRTRLAAGKTLRDEDLHRPPEFNSDRPASTRSADLPAGQAGEPKPTPPPEVADAPKPLWRRREEVELTRELERLRRRITR